MSELVGGEQVGSPVDASEQGLGLGTGQDGLSGGCCMQMHLRIIGWEEDYWPWTVRMRGAEPGLLWDLMVDRGR